MGTLRPRSDDIDVSKLEDLRFYDIRAAGITAMLSAGVPAAVVQKIAGHAHIQTTMRYVGNLSAQQEAAAAKMATALSA